MPRELTVAERIVAVLARTRFEHDLTVAIQVQTAVDTRVRRLLKDLILAGSKPQMGPLLANQLGERLAAQRFGADEVVLEFVDQQDIWVDRRDQTGGVPSPVRALVVVAATGRHDVVVAQILNVEGADARQRVRLFLDRQRVLSGRRFVFRRRHDVSTIARPDRVRSLRFGRFLAPEKRERERTRCSDQ